MTLAPRQWTISGWHASTPGTGAVYVDGPTLAPGEAVTVTETHDQGAPMYTTDGRIVLKQGQPLLEVVASDENANETAGIVASMLNEHDRDEKLLESFAQAISDRAA